MSRFTLRLLLGSMRWVAPTLFLVVWILLVASDPGPGLSAAGALFPGFLAWATWIAVATGNLDDDPHRDLLAAAAGSAGRLHQARAAAVVALGAGVAAAVALLVAGVAPEPGRPLWQLVPLVAGVLVAAVLVGVGIGTLLHRPLIRDRGTAVLAAVLAVGGVMVLPLTHRAIRPLDDSRSGPALLYLAGAAVWALATVTLASRLADHRAR